MSKKKLIIILLVIALLGASSAGISKLMDYRKGASDYSEAASLALAGFTNTRKPSGSRSETSSAQSDGNASPDESQSSSPDSSKPSDDVESAPASSDPGVSEPSEQVDSEAPGQSPEESGQPDDITPSEPPTSIEEDEFALSLAKVNLDVLREVNPEVIGWVCIPDTDVSYPLMQTSDNQHYLNNTWKNERSSVGSIFLESTNSPDLSAFNSIIYGHQMNDGSMFGRLERFSNQEYWEEHPNIYIATDDGVFRYDIFSAFRVGIREIVYRLDIEKEKTQQEFIDFCLSRSSINTGIKPDPKDNVVTLSTCTGWGYSQRWVVVGTCTLYPKDFTRSGDKKVVDDNSKDDNSKKAAT